jgi:predicted acetyltransferase
VEKMLEEERVCAGDPPFEIVPYIMTRITHVEHMLSFLRSDRPMKVLLDIQDKIISENQGLFLWEVSENRSACTKVEQSNAEKIRVTIAELTEFVFGKRMITGLEAVNVLSKICINEAV